MKISSFLMLSMLLCMAGFAQVPDIKWVKVEQGGKSFLMSATEITFTQFDAYCQATGGNLPGDNGWGRGNRPVINVSWDDAAGFCRWLSNKTGSEVRLPTESEWVYAATGGCKSRGYTYSGSNNGDEVSWSEGNSGHMTHPVGTKKPNELGLYDMSGNVWEWCTESINSNEPDQPVRGDSNGNPPSNPRSMSIKLDRNSRHNNIGFRIVKII